MNKTPGKRIVITGTFCALNKGDAAMRIALTDALRMAIPGCHITLTTPFPLIDRSTYTGDKIVRCSRRRPARLASLLVRAAIWRALYGVFRLDMAGILNEELHAYRDSDIVVDLSGDGLTEEYGVKCIYSHMAPIILGKLLAKPVFVCAQTIGPLRKTTFLCRWLLKRVDRLTARENLTLDHLASLGVKGPTVSLAADMAFLMRPAPRERVAEILEQEGVRRDRPLIGFSVSRLPGHLFDVSAGRTPGNVELEMAETLDRLVEMGLQPVIISHVTGPGERRDDRLEAVRIASLAKSSSKIITLLGDYTPEEIKGVISRMDVFVGVRMHSCIAGLSMGVPTISIAYGPKAFGIMGLAGQESRTIDIREVTADKLFALVKETWQNSEAVRQSLAAEMPKVLALANRNVDIIKDLVKVDHIEDAGQPSPTPASGAEAGQDTARELVVKE
jgi:colanic acid/amylovoran biosynthesis protein